MSNANQSLGIIYIESLGTLPINEQRATLLVKQTIEPKEKLANETAVLFAPLASKQQLPWLGLAHAAKVLGWLGWALVLEAEEAITEAALMQIEDQLAHLDTSIIAAALPYHWKDSAGGAFQPVLPKGLEWPRQKCCLYRVSQFAETAWQQTITEPEAALLECEGGGLLRHISTDQKEKAAKVWQHAEQAARQAALHGWKKQWHWVIWPAMLSRDALWRYLLGKREPEQLEGVLWIWIAIVAALNTYSQDSGEYA